MSAAKAITAIQEIKTRDELDQVFEALRLRQTWLARQATRKFLVGDKVKFNGGARRGWITGKITKVNPKNVKVDAGARGRWNVNASLIEAA